jgi:hypothetical protein
VQSPPPPLPPPQQTQEQPSGSPDASMAYGDEALINELDTLEARVADLLREVQKSLGDISGYMLSGIMAAFVGSVAGVRIKVPDLLNLRHVNETLEENVRRMRTLE